MSALEIKEVTKRYGNNEALTQINLLFPTGIHALLGPNGAGKTTLMRCILGLTQYEGSICCPSNATIGYLPQDFRMFVRLTVYEAMQYFSVLKRSDPAQIEKTLKRTGLLDQSKKKVSNLSGGMLRRLGIAQAILGDSELIILDEPTAGLDPKRRIAIRNLIAELGHERTVLLSTHIVEDVEHIADTIAILHKGRVVTYGPKQALLQKGIGWFDHMIEGLQSMNPFGGSK